MAVDPRKILKKIEIQKYNPDWKLQFESLEQFLSTHLKNDILKIEHVGSTAIPGMRAKPIIDVDIIIEDDQRILQIVIAKLAALGYQHLGEMGISGRESFKRKSSEKQIGISDNLKFKHHLYVCRKGSIALQNHLALKKHLLENPAKITEYGDLKEMLAKKYPEDMEAYVDGKTDFILAILKKEGMASADHKLIENQNKMLK